MQTEQVSNNFFVSALCCVATAAVAVRHGWQPNTQIRLNANAKSSRCSIMWMWKRIRLLHIRGHFIQFHSSLSLPPFFFLFCVRSSCCYCCFVIAIFELHIKSFLCGQQLFWFGFYYPAQSTTIVKTICTENEWAKNPTTTTATKSGSNKEETVSEFECIQCMFFGALFYVHQKSGCIETQWHCHFRVEQ